MDHHDEDGDPADGIELRDFLFHSLFLPPRVNQDDNLGSTLSLTAWRIFLLGV